jgi:hypothetical protein
MEGQPAERKTRMQYDPNKGLRSLQNKYVFLCTWKCYTVDILGTINRTLAHRPIHNLRGGKAEREDICQKYNKTYTF